MMQSGSSASSSSGSPWGRVIGLLKKPTAEAVGRIARQPTIQRWQQASAEPLVPPFKWDEGLPRTRDEALAGAPIQTAGMQPFASAAVFAANQHYVGFLHMPVDPDPDVHRMAYTLFRQGAAIDTGNITV